MLQVDIALALASDHQSLTMIGDKNQAIYGWRFADCEMNFQRLRQRFPATQDLYLTVNYRSTHNIVTVLQSVMTDAPASPCSSTPASSSSSAAASNPLVWVQEVLDPSEEASWVISKLLELRPESSQLDEVQRFAGFASAASGITLANSIDSSTSTSTSSSFSRARSSMSSQIRQPYNHVAILARNHAHLHSLCEALRTHRVPFHMVRASEAGVPCKQAEVSVFLAYLAVVAAPSNADAIGGLAFTLPLIETDLFDGHPLLLAAHHIHEALRTEQLTVAQALQFILAVFFTEPLNTTPCGVTALPITAPLIRTSPSPVGCMHIHMIVDLVTTDDARALSGMNVLHWLVTAARLLEDAPAAATDADSIYGTVTLSTIHAAKGCEWNTVFLIRAEEGVLPTAWSAQDEAKLNEERRLMYVALSRARHSLHVSYCMDHASDQKHGRRHTLSRFLKSLPATSVRHERCAVLPSDGVDVGVDSDDECDAFIVHACKPLPPTHGAGRQILLNFNKRASKKFKP
jgi:ATP-dependent DNA helicase Rep